MASGRVCGSVIASIDNHWCDAESRRRTPRELLSSGGQGLSFLSVGREPSETEICVGRGAHASADGYWRKF